MRNANLSDAELAAYSGEHLLYEFQYLWFSAHELSRLRKPQPMASVFIESFGIHLRNLIDFFCTATGKERDDDIIASDFCPTVWNESISNTLKDARDRANKELSHLTLGRKSGSDPSKPWDVNGLYKEITGIALRFVSQASPTRLSPEVGKWLALARLPTIVVAGPMMASNTTSVMTTVASVVSPTKTVP